MRGSTPGADVARAGQRLHHKVLLALALSSVLPILVLLYVSRRYVLPNLNPTDAVYFYALQLLLLSTLIAMVAGAVVMWDVGRIVSRMADLLGDDSRLVQLEQRKDEVGSLMQSFTKMLETIEHQAAEISNFASRLDAAYKELESANTRLKETSFKDEVTGLYNRRFFTIRLDEEMQRHRRFNHPVSVVLIDLDGFKAVNDDLGHAEGDESLRDVA
jgi:predicted signal transduction protein with EAL and GGDEF domain